MVNDRYILPIDVVIVAADQLPPNIRASLTYDKTDFSITRRNSRTHTKILSADATDLVQQFRTPKTLISAIIDYSNIKDLNPEEVLEGAIDMLVGLISDNLLISSESNYVTEKKPAYNEGDFISNYKIVRMIQTFEESSLYEAISSYGQRVALKIARPDSQYSVDQLFDNEIRILEHLDGRNCPKLIESNNFENQRFIAIEWIEGISPGQVTSGNFEELPLIQVHTDLFLLCCNIVYAYASLHEYGVIHADVHPRNLLINREGKVIIIDFGYSRLMTDTHRVNRGGVPTYFEPELAIAHLNCKPLPMASNLGEQYAVAAIIYRLLTDRDYLFFSMTKEDMLNQIVEQPPLPLTSFQRFCPPAVEKVILSALSKNPADRYESMHAFYSALYLAVEATSSIRSAFTSVRNGGTMSSDKLVDETVNYLEPNEEMLATVFQNAPSCNLNWGATGIAYALYRIAGMRGCPDLLAKADIWCSRAQDQMFDPRAYYNKAMDLGEEVLGCSSLYHTAPGIFCVQVLISMAMGDIATAGRSINQYIEAISISSANHDLVLGTSGALLGCAIIYEACHEQRWLDLTTLQNAANRLMLDLWNSLENVGPIVKCGDILFLGIAHGWAGMLYATMRWCNSSAQQLPSGLEGRLLELADLKIESADGLRWYRHLLEKNFMAGWCNGEAGHVYLWTEAYRTFKKDDYIILAEGAGITSWKSPETSNSLCCGTSGRAYSLLHLYKVTQNKAWYNRACELASKALAVSSSGYSLYKGILGVSLLISDLQQPEAACMPMFDRE